MSRAIVALSKAVALLLIARAVPVAEFGYVALAFALVDVFRQFSDFGLEVVTTRELARRVPGSESSRLLGTALALKLISGTAGYAGLLVVASVVGGAAAVPAAAVVGPLVVTWSATTAIGTRFQARLEMAGFSWAPAVGALIGLVLVAALARYSSLLPLAAVLVLGDGIGALLSLCVLRVRSEGPLHFDARMARSLLAGAWAVALTQLLVVAYFRLDVMLLARLSGPEAVGVYSVPVRLTEPLLLVPAALGASVYGAATPLWGSGQIGGGVRVYRSLAAAAGAYGTAAAIGVTALAPLTLAFFPAEYQGSTTALRILAWSLPFMAFNMVTTATLHSLGRYRATTAIAAACLAVNTVANLTLIPRLEVIGACLATIITEAVNCVLHVTTIARILGVLRRTHCYNPRVQGAGIP